MFGNRMKTTAIPERVYALCRAVASKPVDDAVLKKSLEPQQLGGKTQYYGDVKAAASELMLINEKENNIYLAVDKSIVKSPDIMRQYINLNWEIQCDSLFYKVTQVYFDMDIEVLEHSSVSKMSDLMSTKIGVKVVEDDMRAWRFWIPFLGLGYLHEPQTKVAGIILPNTGIFIKDIIEGLKIKKNTEYTIDAFVSVIQPYANIVLKNAFETKKLNFGFSNGLRMLDELGVLIVEHRSDAQEIWSLYPMSSDDEDDIVTHITIGGVK